MTTETPLTRYIYGRTSDDRITVDMIGLVEDQETARERFKEQHDKVPASHLFVYPDCEDVSPYHAENSNEKYGVYQ